MSIRVKALERRINFDSEENSKDEYRYVLRPILYNKLDQSKVIEEASLRSGVPVAAIRASWSAIGEIITSWMTEGHPILIPGLGTMRIGIRSTSVEDVNDVSSDLIKSCRVIFTPCVEIKKALKKMEYDIICVDRNGKVVKRTGNNSDDLTV